MRLLVATRSAHKLLEIRSILRNVPELDIVGPDGAGVERSPEEEDLEPFETFEENARSKADYFHAKTGLPTVADDSGLVVDALDGRPGVRSKRFAPTQGLSGETQDRSNNEHLVDQLAGVSLPQRTARYVCAAVLVWSGGIWSGRGEAEGLVLDRPQGRGGFGYDPYFFDPLLGKTFAELGEHEKNERSHRGAAFRALRDFLMARGDVGAGSEADEEARPRG